MKTRWLALVLPLAVIGGGLALSQEPDPMKMMELMKKYRTPGERHEKMKVYLGEWNWELEMSMGPGVPPMKSGGTATNRWLVDGMWVISEMKGSMMGMPFEGYSISGFDLYKKKYVAMTVNNLNTAMLTMEGVVVDPTGKIEVSYGTLDEYLTGEHDKPVKYVTRFIDDNHYVFEVHDLGAGPDGLKVMTFKFTRKE